VTPDPVGARVTAPTSPPDRPRVERELTEDLRRVRGKEAILFRPAEAAVEHSDDTVRAEVFSVVGEKTKRELVREAKANEHAFKERLRKVSLDLTAQ